MGAQQRRARVARQAKARIDELERVARGSGVSKDASASRCVALTGVVGDGAVMSWWTAERRAAAVRERASYISGGLEPAASSAAPAEDYLRAAEQRDRLSGLRRANLGVPDLGAAPFVGRPRYADHVALEGGAQEVTLELDRREPAPGVVGQVVRPSRSRTRCRRATRRRRRAGTRSRRICAGRPACGFAPRRARPRGDLEPEVPR